MAAPPSLEVRRFVSLQPVRFFIFYLFLYNRYFSKHRQHTAHTPQMSTLVQVRVVRAYRPRAWIRSTLSLSLTNEVLGGRPVP